MTEMLASKLAETKQVLSGSSAAADHSEGMSYLERLPRRLITLYLPLFIILTVLLFPFYWMALTAIKPDEQLLDLERFNPFWTWNPTFKHIYKLLFETYYPLWLWNTMLVAVSATVLSIVASVLAAYAIVRLRYKGAQWVGGAIFLAYLVPPQTPQGSLRSSAPVRQASLTLHPRHIAFAVSTSSGDSAKNSSGSAAHGRSNPDR